MFTRVLECEPQILKSITSLGYEDFKCEYERVGFPEKAIKVSPLRATGPFPNPGSN